MAGDFVHYDPWEGVLTSAANAKALTYVPRQVLRGHPTGFMFSDDYVPPMDLDDPNTDNGSTGLAVLMLATLTASNLSQGISDTSLVAPAGWNVTKALMGKGDPRLVIIRSQLTSCGATSPPSIITMNEMLARAAANVQSFSGPSNPRGGAGPSPGYP